MLFMRILIAAGGSGGHIFPAIALARSLEERDSCLGISFVGSNKALDKRIFAKENFPYFLMSANKLPYRATLRMFLFFVKLSFDIMKAFLIIASYRPDVIVGFGGYVSWPVIFAGYIFRIPKIIHEQNVIPGRSNKILFKFADRIALSFEETNKYLDARQETKGVFTGNPIRASLVSVKGGPGSLPIGDRQLGIRKLGLEEGKFTILVVGGSQGSHFLNKTFIDAIFKLDENTREALQIIHITGIKDYEWASKEYARMGMENRVYSFIDRIEDAYSASDLIVTRSGASAIFEIAFFGKPMVLVPYPFANGHQAENAAVFSRKGAAITISEEKLSDAIFREMLLELLNDKVRLNDMAASAKLLSVPEASDNLAGHVLELARKGYSCY